MKKPSLRSRLFRQNRLPDLLMFKILWIGLVFPLAVHALETVTIGVLAKRGTEMTLEKWSATADYLTESLPGYKFVIQPLAFDEVENYVKSGAVDLILVNSGMFALLENFYQVRGIVTMKNRVGKYVLPYFGGVIFSRLDLPDFRNLEDLNGRSFVAVSDKSLGGFQMAWREMKRKGIDPYKDLASLRFVGTHDNVVNAVLKGDAEVGTVRTDTLERMASEGKIDLTQIKTIEYPHQSNDGSSDFPYLHSTELYPEWPMASLKHTSLEFSEKVAKALINMPTDSQAAKDSKTAGWTIPLNYRPVHNLYKDLKLPPYEPEPVTFQQYLSENKLTVGLTLLILLSGLVYMVHIRRINTRLKAAKKRLQTAIIAAERVAAGDLTVHLEACGSDEACKLISALQQMVHHLNSLIGQVQRSSFDLVSTANGLSAMSRTQSEEVNNLDSTTTEIAAATQEISATAEELLKTMGGLTEVTNHTTELANAGQSTLGNMETAMRTLADATQSISGRLGLINEKANTIGSVTTTITKIADLTNLLSLNASIEAEKAGEYGLGFAVLAREIRRLADQTAVATLDIEQMVREMQDAVTGGVMEMDKFSEQVHRSVADTQDISQRFGEIIQQVQALLPQFDAVHDGMRSQSTGARHIRDAMLTLSESVRVSAQALEETQASTHRLEGAIGELRQEIAVFKLDF